VGELAVVQGRRQEVEAEEVAEPLRRVAEAQAARRVLEPIAR
jgi:hypothetical protein